MVLHGINVICCSVSSSTPAAEVQMVVTRGSGGYMRGGHISNPGIPAGTDAESEAQVPKRAAGCSWEEDKNVQGG